MRIQEHIDKITWSLADKLLYVIYGLVLIFQMRITDPDEFGVYALLISIHTYIFVITDIFALTNIIQFGAKKENQARANYIALVYHLSITAGLAVFLYLFRFLIADFFHEERLIIVGKIIPLLCLIFIPRTYCLKLVYRDSKMSFLFWINFAFFGVMSILTFYYINTKDILLFDDLVDIYLIGSITSSVVAVILTFNKLKFSKKGEVTFRQFFDFSLPNLFTGVLNYFPKQVDLLVVQYFFSASAVGVYYLAKTLFRVFDESYNAAVGLIYPAAVRVVQYNDKERLQILMTKSISFLFVCFLITIIFLELGGTDLFVKLFLPEKYYFAIGQFNLLIISSLFLPFNLLGSSILAFNKPYIVTRFITISVLLSFITFVFVGYIGEQSLIPLGMIVYSAVYGILCYCYVKKHVDLPITSIFRAFDDTISFIRKKIS